MADSGAFRFHPKCKRMKITKLCFTDDLILICRGDKSQLLVFKEQLLSFERVSGLGVNVHNNSLYIAGLSPGEEQVLIYFAGIPRGGFPMKSLGVPFTTKRMQIEQYRPLMDKILQRIPSWEARLLAYAGRAMVKWDDVCQPKKTGGLGIKKLHSWNVSLVPKRIWAIERKEDSLWIKWVHEYYVKGGSIWDTLSKSSHSWVWKGILRIRDTVLQLLMGDPSMEVNVYPLCFPNQPRIPWWRLVWCKKILPKHGFILLLAYKNKLGVKRWISISMGLLMKRTELAGKRRRRLAAMVYAVWQERNSRLFHKGARLATELAADVIRFSLR